MALVAKQIQHAHAWILDYVQSIILKTIVQKLRLTKKDFLFIEEGIMGVRLCLITVLHRIMDG